MYAFCMPILMQSSGSKVHLKIEKKKQQQQQPSSLNENDSFFPYYIFVEIEVIRTYLRKGID